MSAADVASLANVLGGNQALATAISDLVRNNRITTAVATAPVYDADHETFIHKYLDEEGNNQSVQLMTEAQLLTFYKDVMKLNLAQIRELKSEGLEYPMDFASFDSEEVEATIKSMRSKDLALGGLSQLLLKRFCDFMQYLEVCGRKCKFSYLNAQTLRHHADSYSAIKEKTKDAKLTPIKKNGDILAWLDDANKDLKNIIGNRGVSLLSYVIVDREIPDANRSSILDFKDGKCFSRIHGSLKEELIQRASHDHPNTEDDIAMLYKLLDTATKSTSFNSTIQAFVEDEDGVGCYNALYKEYGGKAKWEKQYSALVIGLALRKWKSTGTVTMSTHTGFHRDHHQRMVRAANHIDVTVPSQRQRCIALIDSIDSTHPDVSAHLSSIKADPNGMGSDFDLTAEHLMKSDPVEKTLTKTKKGLISSTLGGRGNDTGVEFRWYSPPEFKKLTTAQKEELIAWRQSAVGKASIKASTDAYKKRKNESNISGLNADGNPKLSKKQKSRYNKAVKVAATEMLKSVISSAKAETQQNQVSEMQQQITDLQVSGGTNNDGTANTSSVTTGKTVTFDQAFVGNLKKIMGKATGKRN